MEVNSPLIQLVKAVLNADHYVINGCYINTKPTRVQKFIGERIIRLRKLVIRITTITISFEKYSERNSAVGT